MTGKRAPLRDRFLAKIRIAEDGCWVWTAALNNHGYGQIYSAGKPRKAYRVAYELFVGPIPEGLQIDHLCRNRKCVNPAHLEAVTSAENSLRGNHPSWTTRRTQICKRGHDLRDPKHGQPGRNGGRSCRTCARMTPAERRAYVHDPVTGDWYFERDTDTHEQRAVKV